MTRMYSRVLEGILKIIGIWGLCSVLSISPFQDRLQVCCGNGHNALAWFWGYAAEQMSEKWIVGHFTNVVHSRRHGGGGQ